MKKCPFCKAELEENARFCLYCMAQLDEKSVITAKRKKRRLIWAGVSFFAVLLALVFVFLLSDRNGKEGASTLSQTESVVESAISLPYSSEEESDLSEKSESSVSEQESSFVDKEDSSGDSSEDSSEISVESGEVLIESSVVETSVEDSSVEDSSVENSEDTSQPKEEIKYIYRDAVVGDDWGSISTENAITIIGVETVSADGTYVIPDTIDGKRVLAVASNAFSDEKICGTVKKVIVAESIKNIHNYAFKNCFNMTDIYLKSEAVAGSPHYFLPDLEKRKNVITLHASATCHDRNHRTYKSIYSYADFTGKPIGIFEEWNGLE